MAATSPPYSLTVASSTTGVSLVNPEDWDGAGGVLPGAGVQSTVQEYIVTLRAASGTLTVGRAGLTATRAKLAWSQQSTDGAMTWPTTLLRSDLAAMTLYSDSGTPDVYVQLSPVVQ
jgi:hypothetical protein